MPSRRVHRYERLLRLRRQQEERKAQELMAARRRVEAAIERRAALLRQQEIVLQSAGIGQGRIDAGRVRDLYEYAGHLARVVLQQDVRIGELRETEEAHRRELEHETKQRRMMERLSARARTVWAAELARAERKQMDETAAIRAARVIQNSPLGS